MSVRSIKNKLMEKAVGPVDNRILGYIVNNFNSVAYMNHDKLCYHAQCSPAELNEFFRAFGTEDLLSFKAVLREVVYNESDGPDDLEDRSIRGIADMVMRHEMANIAEFSAALDEGLIGRFAQDLLSATEVYIVGMHSATSTALYAADILNKVGVKARIIDTADVASVVNMERTGLVLAISYSRYHKATINLLSHLRKNGYNIVSITDYPMSPAGKLSNYCFCCPRHSHDYTVSSLTLSMLLNIVAIHIGMQDKSGLVNRIRRYDEVTQNLDYFF